MPPGRRRDLRSLGWRRDPVAEIGRVLTELRTGFVAHGDLSPTLPDVVGGVAPKCVVFSCFSLNFERSAALPDTVPDQVATPRAGRQAPTGFHYDYSTRREHLKGDP